MTLARGRAATGRNFHMMETDVKLNKIISTGAAVLSMTCALTFSTASFASNSSGPPVRFVVPFTPGGSNDILARVIAPHLSKRLNRNVIVENKPGASGNIGMAYVAKAEPDGSTIVVAGSQVTTNPALGVTIPFDIEKDFAPIGMIAEIPMIFVVNPKVPYKTLEDFVAYAKKNPGEINFSSPGLGVPQHLAGELLASLADIDITHVPYQGTGPSVADTIGGQVQSTFGSMGSVLQNIKNGDLIPLGIARNRRTAVLPDVPAFSESENLGLGSYNASLWFSVMAPAKTPPAVIQQFNDALNDTLRQPEVQKHLNDLGFEISMTTPEELNTIIKNDLALWKKVADQNDLNVNK